MNHFRTIVKATFFYKWRALATILFNFFFVIFNLFSLILFVPFLRVIFPANNLEKVTQLNHVPPGIDGFFEFLKNQYEYFMQSMVERNPKEALLFVCVAVVISFFLKNLFRYLAIYHQSELRLAVVRDYRNKLFKKSMFLPLSFYTEEKKGDLMSRMNSDVMEIDLGVVAILELLFRDPLSVIITLGVLIYWSLPLTLFALILLPISALVISRIGKSLKRTAKKGQEQMGILYSFLDEYLGGIRIVKAFNAVGQSIEKFSKINLHQQKLHTRTLRKRDLSSPLNEFLGSVVMVFLVWFGGSMILNNDSGSFQGQEFIGFIIVFSQLLVPIQNISKNFANLSKASVSQNRIDAILSADEVINDPVNPVPFPTNFHGIKFKNVSFSYMNETVLNDIDLQVLNGKSIAIVGESGSGKSTLADLIPRFYDPKSGSIEIDNIPIKEFKIAELRNQIGIVNQESILFNDSIFNNISFGKPTATLDEVLNAAKIANAHEFILELSEGYETVIGERGNKLSGGQKQRLSIARAVLKNPPILILDEATSALDTENEKLVQLALDNLMKNRTSIVIAHRLSTIKNANEIIVLNKGKIVERGTHQELYQKEGYYFKLCTLQSFS